jgi:hypothetical protein
VEKVPNACAYQVLFEIAILVSIDLGARIIQELILDESTPLWIEEVV